MAIGNIGIGNISTMATFNKDRFLIVDDRELYLIGASLKDLGKKCFAFTKFDAGEIRRIKREAFAAGGSRGNVMHVRVKENKA